MRGHRISRSSTPAHIRDRLEHPIRVRGHSGMLAQASAVPASVRRAASGTSRPVAPCSRAIRREHAQDRVPRRLRSDRSMSMPFTRMCSVERSINCLAMPRRRAYRSGTDVRRPDHPAPSRRFLSLSSICHCASLASASRNSASVSSCFGSEPAHCFFSGWTTRCSARAAAARI